MRCLWLWLTILTPLAFPDVGLANSPPEPQTGSAHGAASDPTVQQEPIREALARLQRANRLLDPPETTDKQTADDVLRQRPQSGQPIAPSAPSALAELLETVDRREKRAIEQLARQFRTQVYRTFRQRRGVFTRRRAAWSRVLTSWEEAGGDFAQQGLLIDWLELAIKSSTPGTAGPLPSDPGFQTVATASEAVVLQEPVKAVDRAGLADALYQPSISSEWVSRQNPIPAVAWPRPEDNTTSPLPSIPRQPSLDSPSAPPANGLFAASASPPRVAQKEPLLARADRVRRLPSVGGLRVGGPPVVDRTVPAILPPRSTTSQTLPTSTMNAERRHNARPLLGLQDQPASDASLLERNTWVMLRATARARRPAGGGPQQAAAEPRSRPTPTAMGKPAMVESAPLLTMDDPFRQPPAAPALLPGNASDPAVTAADGQHDVAGRIGQLTSREMAPLGNVATPPCDVMPTEPQTAGQSSADRIDESSSPVNINELLARIAGNNLALRALEAELDDPRPWDARRLSPLVDCLKGVVARGKDLTLIRDLVTQHEQSMIGRLESPQAAVAQLATRIFKARTRAVGSRFGGSLARRRAELQALDELSRTLALIAMGG